MSVREAVNRLERLDMLIRLKCTGRPKELAEKLGVSERWVYEMINQLKYDFDCPIIYSRSRQSYIYQKRGRFIAEFVTEEKRRTIFGGSSNGTGGKNENSLVITL